MKHVADEALHEPLFRAALAAAAVGGIGLCLGAEWHLVLLIAVATGVITRELSVHFQDLARHALSVQDHQTLLTLLETGSRPPLFGAWAISPDFGRLLVEKTRGQPRVVVECGSGVSTLVLASALRANNAGKLYSLEHDSGMAEKTRTLLRDARLHGWAEVIHAPLASQTFGTTKVDWYDPGSIPDLTGLVDLLVIDGPPPTAPLSRWPALEILYPMLSSRACVLLDDGRRRSERRVAVRWASAFPDLDLYWIDTVKGTWMLSRNPEAVHASPLVSAARRVRRTLHPRPPGFEQWPILR